MIDRLRFLSRKSDARDGGPFVQLWVIALVFSLLFTLFLSIAMMDVRRLEDMVLNHRVKKAEYVVEGIEKASEDSLDHVIRIGDHAILPSGALAPEAGFASQESMERSLIELAEHIGYEEQVQGFSQGNLFKVAQSEGLSAIAVLDERGETVVGTGSLPEALMPRMREVIDGHREAASDLPEETGRRDSFGFVGIRRHGGGGAVILVLDSEDLRHWRLKAAVKVAVKEVRWLKGVNYLVFEDRQGRQLAEVGKIPADIVRDREKISRNVRGPENAAGRLVTAIDPHAIEISLPFQLHDEDVGTARVGLWTNADQFVTEERHHIFLWTGMIIFIGFAVMWVLYRTQNKHIAKLQAIRERLHRAERHSSLARLAAGVAHEIRNPLNAISMAAQRLQRDYAPPEESANRQEFERITFIVRDEIKRLNGIIEDFLSLSQTDRMELLPHPVVELVERVLFLVRDEAQARGIRIEGHWTEPTAGVLMNTRKMEQALLNVVRNAMDSISGEGSIVVNVDGSGKNRVSIRVEDSGTGIEHEELGRIFDPFYTTKQNGTGIGLCIANEIVVAHGGEILVHSEPGRGTIFNILLPREPL